MKKIIIALALAMAAKAAIAQKELLSLDEHNKYIFYQVDTVPLTSGDTLHVRGIRFLKMISPKIKLMPATSPDITTGRGNFISRGTSIIKHLNGEVDYQVNIECKDQKFRLWLTDLTFIPYQRDRYGNFVPKPGIVYPLEKLSDNLERREADAVLIKTAEFCKEMSNKLKLYMKSSFTPKKDEKLKKVVTDKW